MRFTHLARDFLAVGLTVAATLVPAALPVDPFSRWTPKPVEGAERLKAGGPGGATVVLLRRDMAPLRSFDGGATWTPFTLPGTTYEVSIAPSAPRTWYVFINSGSLYRTVDGGDTWERHSPPVSAPFSAGSLSISADPTCGGTRRNRAGE